MDAGQPASGHRIVRRIRVVAIEQQQHATAGQSCERGRAGFDRGGHVDGSEATMSMRVIQGSAARRPRTPIEDAYVRPPHPAGHRTRFTGGHPARLTTCVAAALAVHPFRWFERTLVSVRCEVTGRGGGRER